MKGCLTAKTVLLLGLVLYQSVMTVHAAANAALDTADSMSTEWSAEEWAIARSLSPLPPLPPDPTNALAVSQREQLPNAHTKKGVKIR